MAEAYTDEWLAMVLEQAAGLPAVENVSFIFDAEISEAAQGKVRAHGRVIDGQLVELAPGKFKPTGDESVDVTFAAKAKRLDPVLAGDVSPLVAYMRGELKIDGSYERVIDHLANQGDRAALANLRDAVAAQTE